MRKVIIISCACIALGACVPVDRGLGETVRWNNTAQLVNPEGTRASPGAPIEGGSGKKGQAAVDRYEKGTVKEPPRENSQTSGGGGSGSSVR
jgi:hypothetical protein